MSDQPTNSTDIDCIYKTFQSKIADGPMYVSTCCTQTFFRHSVCMTSLVRFKHQYLMNVCLSNIKSVNNNEWICKTCLLAVQQGKIPVCSTAKNKTFPIISEQLNITHPEERLISPRLAFMQLRELPRGGQLNLKGNVENVPADVNATVKQLPRMLDDTETIPVKLKRKLSYKHSVAFENIKPNKVLEDAYCLVEHSDLFKNEGIEINDSWLEAASRYIQSEEVEDHQNLVNDAPDGKSQNLLESKDANQSSDDWTEDDNFHDRPTRNTDIVLQAMDFREYNQILSLAPGENQTPLGLFQNVYSEYLAFPSIYCGQARSDNSLRSIPVHYSNICKWELRNVARRAAMFIPNIFYKLKRLQFKQIRDNVTLAVRKCKTKGKK